MRFAADMPPITLLICYAMLRRARRAAILFTRLFFFMMLPLQPRYYALICAYAAYVICHAAAASFRCAPLIFYATDAALKAVSPLFATA